MIQETIEEVAQQFEYTNGVYGFKQGAKWQQERSYSEDDLEEAFKSGFVNCYNNNNLTFGEWFEQFKKITL